MTTGRLTTSLKALWSGVDPYPVVSVLYERAQRDEEGVAALVADATALDGPDAASHLVLPVLEELSVGSDATARSTPSEIWRALHTLVRAGADPDPLVEPALKALTSDRTRDWVAQALCSALLLGWRFDGLAARLPGAAARDSPRVRQVWRVARLSEEDPALVESLARAYVAQPVSNLFGAIGLLEEQLLTDDAAAEARDALVALVAAGDDLHASWMALLPVLLHQLGVDDNLKVAASMLGQARYALREGAGIPAGALGLLAARLDGVAGAEVANTLETFSRLGADLTSIRSVVEGALDDDRLDVRSACSRALSIWLWQMGEEAPLPGGCFHRRTWAASDVPLQGHRPRRCPSCGEMAGQVIYEWQEPAQFYAAVRMESLCSACGVYETLADRAPG